MSKCDLPLHGLTVVVDTAGPRVYIGRYDVEDDRGVLLRDVDVRDLDAVDAKPAYLARTAKFGVFKNTDHVRVPHEEITSIRRLSEISPEA
ncbi:MAG: hypothetical protein KDA27_16425 [Candidatus Eisenbacteria bacterium]|uniref:Uncharacterized protein n=1 Tax=Eiseniibacteriota bacterium TaxID=2212470 RepID=A0A956NEE4_UNCEI|nr:hypothetical protein [Candidatus Eisenbacteria bacterium]MCB9464538.1 hypothetical protein [Candidatus Eisenbacteria bacterium]